MNFINTINSFIKDELQKSNQSIRMARIIIQSNSKDIYQRKRDSSREIELTEHYINKMEVLFKCRELLQ